MSLINVPSKKLKISQFGAISPLTNQRTGSPNFLKGQSEASEHKLSKGSIREEGTQTIQKTNETKIFIKSKNEIDVIRCSCLSPYHYSRMINIISDPFSDEPSSDGPTDTRS